MSEAGAASLLSPVLLLSVVPPVLSSLPLSLSSPQAVAPSQDAYGQDGCELPSASQDASLLVRGPPEADDRAEPIGFAAHDDPQPRRTRCCYAVVTSDPARTPELALTGHVKALTGSSSGCRPVIFRSGRSCQRLRARTAASASSLAPMPTDRSSTRRFPWCRSYVAPPGERVPAASSPRGSGRGTSRSPRHQGSAGPPRGRLP